MIKPIPIRISRAGRMGRAEFEVSGHRVTVLTTTQTGATTQTAAA